MMSQERVTHILLTCGAIAGPFYVLLGIGQILSRPGFDITKHALSLLSNGYLGWIQITNFIIAGALVITFAASLRMALAGSKAGTFGPILLAIYGLGMIGAGIFPADPALGFPIGTPETISGISTTGLMHFVFGGIGFYSLIAATFVFARKFRNDGNMAMTWFSIVTGLVFFISFAAIASVSSDPALRPLVTVGFYFAILLVWIWLTMLSLTIRQAVDRHV
ncbi:MAG: DUF998 domain-containing protein [Pyrinomonadaceae bacterium]